MELIEFVLISLGFLFVAIAYSSVGHAGASGYTAVLAFFSFTPEFMRPVSLLLNVAVGIIGLIRFYKADLIQFGKVGPFLLGSVPMTYLSARMPVDKSLFSGVLGGVLLLSAVKIFWDAYRGIQTRSLRRKVNPLIAVVSGAVIGVMAGLTGTGGAIFFTPLLIHFNWTNPREASGLSIVFVLVNSIFGLAGTLQTSPSLPLQWVMPWIFVVLVGAFIGTKLSIQKFSGRNLKMMIGLVLFIAAIKLLSRLA